MKSIFRLLMGSLTFGVLSSQASAHDRFPGLPLARATYDCPPGPGYMTFSVVDSFQNRTAHQLWVGSRDVCREQAAKLQVSRAEFDRLSLVGICVGQGDVYYLRRWSVDPYGQNVYQGQIYYGLLADCMLEADVTNR